MRALDTDKDGEISATEIENAAASLKMLDKDGDGAVSREEIRRSRAAGALAVQRATTAGNRRRDRTARIVRPATMGGHAPLWIPQKWWIEFSSTTRTVTAS